MTVCYQLLPVFSQHDAISGAVREMDTLLKQIGFETHISAELIDDSLRSVTIPANSLLPLLSKDDLLIYHLSIGSPLVSLISSSPAKLIIVYHNITPYSYYESINPRAAYWLHRGEEDLKFLAPLGLFCIADSTYSMAELLEAGADICYVIPPAIDLKRLEIGTEFHHTPDCPVILTVGRIAPNKRIDIIIKAMSALRATTHANAKLHVIGSAVDTQHYLVQLQMLSADLGISTHVTMTGNSCSDTELAKQYKTASVYVTASEHEGFCIPLVEAMASNLPIVAYGSSAIPETVENAAILLPTLDPLLMAEAIGEVIDNVLLRNQLIENGVTRLDGYTQTRQLKYITHAFGLFL